MDKRYFEDIYAKYFKVLFLFALRIVNDVSSAEDIVQDIFAECWSQRKNIDTTFSIKPYLYRLTYNRSIDFLKQSSHKSISLSEDIAALDRIFFTTFIQDDQMHGDELGKVIEKGVAALPERCREVFLLSRRHNLKNREIAERLDISVKAVEKHISKALKDIRIQLLHAGYTLIWVLILFFTPPC